MTSAKKEDVRFYVHAALFHTIKENEGTDAVMLQ